MPERLPGDGNDSEVSKFDALVIALNNALRSRASEDYPSGTPSIDNYIEEQKQKAGSPPLERRT